MLLHIRLIMVAKGCCVFILYSSNVIISFSIIANTTQGTIEQNNIDY